MERIGYNIAHMDTFGQVVLVLIALGLIIAYWRSFLVLIGVGVAFGVIVYLVNDPPTLSIPAAIIVGALIIAAANQRPNTPDRSV